MSDELRIGVEKVDPLTSGPGAAQELFKRFSREAGLGFDFDAVLGASGNMILNVLRQAYPKRAEAMDALDRLLYSCRQSLDGHYDANGKRRSVFPFNQVLEVDHIKFKKTMNTPDAHKC